jgi:hypothetical protein
MKDKQAFPVGSLAHISPIYKGSAIPIRDKVPILQRPWNPMQKPSINPEI